MPLGINSMYAGKDAPWAKGISNLGIALFGDPVFKAQQEQQARAEEWRQQQEATRQAERAQDVAFQKEKFDYEKSKDSGDTLFDNWLMGDQPAPAPGEFDGTLPQQPVIDTAAPDVTAPVATAPAVTTAEAPAGDDYYTKSRVAESSNDYTRQLPQSARDAGQTASGGYAFIDGTWQKMGGTGSAWQAPAEEQDARMRQFTEQNAAAFKAKTGRDPTDSELRALHHFGEPKGLAFISAPDATPMEQVLPAEWFTNNPHLRGKTVGQVKADFRQKFGDGMTWQRQARAAVGDVLPDAAEGPLPDVQQSPLAEMFTGPLPPPMPEQRMAQAAPASESGSAFYGGTPVMPETPPADVTAGGPTLDPQLFMDPGGRLPMLDGEPEAPLPDIAPAAGDATAPPEAAPVATPVSATSTPTGGESTGDQVLPPDVEDGIAQSAPEELLPGVPLNDHMKYLMDSYGLTKRQVAAVFMAPKGERQKTLASILAQKPQSEEGKGGPFAGSGLEASLLNIVYDYQTRKARGEPVTAEDTYAFDVARSQLETPKQYSGADGVVHTYRYKVPEMGGPPVLVEDGGTGQQPPTAPATAGTGTTAPAAAAAATTQDVDTGPPPTTVGNLEIQDLPSGEKALTEGQSKDLVWMARGELAQDQMAEAIKEGAQPGTRSMFAYYNMITSGNPVAALAAFELMNPADQKYLNAMQTFVASAMRKDTGAAVADKEWPQSYQMYAPQPGENPADKDIVRQGWLDSVYVTLGPSGKRAAEELRQMRAQHKSERPATADTTGGSLAHPHAPTSKQEYDAIPAGDYYIKNGVVKKKGSL